MDLEKFRKQSLQLKDQNKQFLKSLKRKNPRDLDKLFHEAHEEAFEEINCLDCANCCKTTSPIFKQKDIENVAKHIRLSPSQFIDKYLHLDKDNDYVLNTAPCPFLDGENYCLVYESRPTACREYPHTDRKKMYQLLDLTYNNTLVCPAVLHIVEQLRKIK
ncbi:MAG TPA: YkgJ family cysteine cluster protein [Bacteroidia bacterium]